MAEFCARDGHICINRGDRWEGRRGVARTAAGFFADVPDLSLVCDTVRCAGDRITCLWTFTGTHSGTGNARSISGWDEWDLDESLKVRAARLV